MLTAVLGLGLGFISVTDEPGNNLEAFQQEKGVN